ncbi:O-antigen ligase family protein [Dechloromonas denitrificans]|uniref:O-antigen ligase family protein n=1 Tax=Dechloromonas denitrificans TaxID=281362 RepID=UPI001CFA2BD6|nr:O-antigen ligase family protein [Dechloromonas denitrificans]UCV09840.1 O-antigen ligase family protein [Dechloromonas denitrificans]
MASLIASQKLIAEAFQRLPPARWILLSLGYAFMVVFFGMAIPIAGVIVPAFIVGLIFLAWTALDYRVGTVLVLVLIHISGTVFIPRELLGVQGLNPINLLILGTIFSYTISHAGKLSIPWTPSLIYAYLLPFMLAALLGTTKVHLIPQAFETMKLVSFSSGFGYFRDLFIKPNFVILAAFLMALVIQEARHPARYVHIISAGCVMLAGAVLGAFIISGASISLLSGANARGFLSILGMHANEISLCLNLGYALLIFSLAGHKGFSRALLFMALIAIAIAVLMTFSRAGIAAFIVINAIFLVRRRQIGTMIVFLMIAAVIGLVFFDPIMERLGTGVETGNRAEISAGRLDKIWLPLLDDFSLTWLFPHGPSAIMWSRPLLNGTMLLAGHTHSAYLGLLYDYGILFGALIVGFLIYLFRQFLHYSKNDPDPGMRHLFEGACVAMLVLALQGISDDRFTPTVAQTPLWCAVGMLIGRGGLRARPKTESLSENLKLHIPSQAT